MFFQLSTCIYINHIVTCDMTSRAYPIDYSCDFLKSNRNRIKSKLTAILHNTKIKKLNKLQVLHL